MVPPAELIARATRAGLGILATSALAIAAIGVAFLLVWVASLVT